MKIKHIQKQTIQKYKKYITIKTNEQCIQMGNRNASNNRRPGQVRNNNAKFGGPIKGGGIRKRNPVDRAKKVLAKNAASKDPDTPADSNEKPKER